MSGRTTTTTTTNGRGNGPADSGDIEGGKMGFEEEAGGDGICTDGGGSRREICRAGDYHFYTVPTAMAVIHVCKLF